MEWYNYLAVFFSGAFLANTVPHFIHGISGDKFPTPFANPPGKGLSSPVINVLWAGFNLLISFILLRAGKLRIDNYLMMLIFFFGIMTMALMLSFRFEAKHKE
ncbi:MAG: hypothetical protein JWR67_11 [Mucilaginibacter sp.]|nr:hypothetical protein [Mucilaginibacter sp.]